MLPKTLKYGSKIESAYSRSMRSNIQPQNGTGIYNLGDTITINIPTRAGLVLVPSESYLKFNVNIENTSTNANAYRWDSCGAHGIVQRIRIYHGSNLLQDIDNYAMLAKMLYDLQVSTDGTYGKYNILSGTRNDLVGRTQTFPTIAGAAAADVVISVNASLTTAAASGFSCQQINSGDRVESTTALVTAGATISNTYCLNLISLIGTLCTQNYLPLYEMSSAPLRCEIQIVDSIYKCLNVLTNVVGGATNVSKLTITNCEYIGNFIELGDSAVSMIKDSLGGAPLQFVVPDYRNYVYNYPLANNATASIAMPIAAKFSSVKAIFITIRDQGSGALQYFPYSSVTRNITDYQLRIGANVMPPKAPNTTPEMFAECIKAIASISDLNHAPSIEKNSYTLASSVNTAALLDGATSVSYQQSGSFYIGIDLESYANSPKDTLFSGYNTNTEDIYALINLGTQPNASNNCRFDAFANFDCVIVCENSTCYARF